MKKLAKLHEQFISQANRPMDLSRLPITPVESEVPVIAVERWSIVGDPKKLVKNFKFMSIDHRNEFVMNLLAYESEVQHNACLNINEDVVNVSLITKNIETVTEIDKEYAAFCDTLFRDIVYSPIYVGQKTRDGDAIFEDFDE